tara:strand:- start:780 stop:2666 length:1887 start_codon:yes stop_codon:yes gene_type:complete
MEGDDFNFNSLNNHGSLGLINMPSARFYNESSFGFTLYDGNPDQKFTMTSYPFDWLEASVFYTNIQGKPYPGYEFQDYKDKGFNFKIRLLEESRYLPAIAIGINDLAGTGFYSSEYIVGSYGINNLDIHLGLGWGTLNGTNDFKNPMSIIHSSFSERPSEFEGRGGQFQPSRYFSDENVSTLFGISYILNDKFLAKIERDTTLTPGLVGFERPKQRFNFGIDFNINNNLTVGISSERGNGFSIRFSYKKDENDKPNYAYKPAEKEIDDGKYDRLIKNLENNGIGVEKIIKKDNKLGIELTQFRHQSLEIIEEILMSSKKDSEIEQEIIPNYKIANLKAIQNYDLNFEDESQTIYERRKITGWNSATKLNLRPFIAAREGFLKASLVVENDNEYVFSDEFFFSSNLKYSIWDNFDDLVIPPVDTYPEQVRSDVKDYLRNFDNGVIIGRAQFDYHLTLTKNHHTQFTAGILEEMFSGYGFEYLYFDNSKNYAAGFELFEVQKRDYELRLGTLDYKALTGHLNFYYRNYNLIPFDAKISYGKYLAGDVGGTIQISRNFQNGIEFGVFATFTDVSTEQFGEGSFDKGIYFNVPVFRDLVSYTWRPLTKDPGAKLLRKHNLYDLLVKFRPYEK